MTVLTSGCAGLYYRCIVVQISVPCQGRRHRAAHLATWEAAWCCLLLVLRCMSGGEGNEPYAWLAQVIGNTVVIAFQYSTKATNALARPGFLTCVLPHHVGARATGKLVLKVWIQGSLPPGPQHVSVFVGGAEGALHSLSTLSAVLQLAIM